MQTLFAIALQMSTFGHLCLRLLCSHVLIVLQASALYFVRQTLQNACGTIALINTVVSGLDCTLHIEPTSFRPGELEAPPAGSAILSRFLFDPNSRPQSFAPSWGSGDRRRDIPPRPGIVVGLLTFACCSFLPRFTRGPPKWAAATPTPRRSARVQGLGFRIP